MRQAKGAAAPIRVADWIADLVSGTATLPDGPHMHRVMEDELAFLRRHYPGSARYALELDPTFYRKQLGRERARVGAAATR